MNKLSLQEGILLQEAIEQYDLSTLLTTLHPYAKVMSLAVLGGEQLPILPTFLFTEWNQQVQQGIATFCQYFAVDMVMMRSQARQSFFGKSYLSVPVSQISQIVRELFANEAGIVVLHPEQNIHRDLYSINVDFGYFGIFTHHRVLLEIVGPGFMATHLSRGGMVQERISLTTYGVESDLLSFERLWKVPDETYQENVQRLIAKYGYEMLEANHSLLLQHRDHYPPIPVAFISYIHRALERLQKASDALSAWTQATVVSMSFICNTQSSICKPVFWDIH